VQAGISVGGWTDAMGDDMGMVRSALLGLAAAGALLLGAATASAEGLPDRIKDGSYRPTYRGMNWSGFYVGVQGGYGWGDTEHQESGVSTGTFDTSGGLVGVTWGTNWQRGNWVYGLEGDFSFSSIDGDFSPSPCDAIGPCFTDIRTLGTSRVRLGYAMDRSLFYVTGGLAYGNVRAGIGDADDDDETRFGWTLGGGIEWAFAPRWSLKAEYLHVDLGRLNYSIGDLSTIDVDVTADIVRVGINYNFGPEFWGDMFGRR
jgi:outer membrane immunogenic protein